MIHLEDLVHQDDQLFLLTSLDRVKWLDCSSRTCLRVWGRSLRRLSLEIGGFELDRVVKERASTLMVRVELKGCCCVGCVTVGMGRSDTLVDVASVRVSIELAVFVVVVALLEGVSVGMIRDVVGGFSWMMTQGHTSNWPGWGWVGWWCLMVASWWFEQWRGWINSFKSSWSDGIFICWRIKNVIKHWKLIEVHLARLCHWLVLQYYRHHQILKVGLICWALLGYLAKIIEL